MPCHREVYPSAAMWSHVLCGRIFLKTWSFAVVDTYIEHIRVTTTIDIIVIIIVFFLFVTISTTKVCCAVPKSRLLFKLIFSFYFSFCFVYAEKDGRPAHSLAYSFIAILLRSYIINNSLLLLFLFTEKQTNSCTTSQRERFQTQTIIIIIIAPAKK